MLWGTRTGDFTESTQPGGGLGLEHDRRPRRRLRRRDPAHRRRAAGRRARREQRRRRRGRSLRRGCGADARLQLDLLRADRRHRRRRDRARVRVGAHSPGPRGRASGGSDHRRRRLEWERRLDLPGVDLPVGRARHGARRHPPASRRRCRVPPAAAARPDARSVAARVRVEVPGGRTLPTEASPVEWRLGLYDAYVDEWSSVAPRRARDRCAYRGLAPPPPTEPDRARWGCRGRARACARRRCDRSALTSPGMHVRRTLTGGLARSLRAGARISARFGCDRSRVEGTMGRRQELASDAVVVAAGLGSARLSPVRVSDTACGRGLQRRVTGVRPTRPHRGRACAGPFNDVVRLAGVLDSEHRAG